jgi:hypothetical protein
MSPPSSPPSPSHSSDPNYWSSSQNWELLWLGHCGDDASPEYVTSHPHLIYSDSTVPHRHKLDGTAHLDNMTSTFLDKHSVPKHTRLVHRSYWPLCTFAYAVTRASAQRILDTYGSGVSCAYDVALLEACRDHDWQCYTITPELFHHTEAMSEIALVNNIVDDKKGGPAVLEQRGPTHNIGCAARSESLWVDERDWRGRAWMVETVRNGQCYRDGVE